MLRPAFEGVPRGDGALDRVAKELLADRVPANPLRLIRRERRRQLMRQLLVPLDAWDVELEALTMVVDQLLELGLCRCGEVAVVV